MSRAESRVMAALADGAWHREDTLRSSFAFLLQPATMALLGMGLLGRCCHDVP